MSVAPYVLAIDHGTTSSRAILYDAQRRAVATSQREGALSYPRPGWVEQDAMAVWLDTMAVVADVLNRSGAAPGDVAAIGISNQRETALLWDKATGLPVYPAIVWQSRQTADVCERWKAQGLEPLVRCRTGLRIDPYFSASKVAWVLEHVPQARERARAGELLFGTMDTWLAWKLSGGAHVTDVSNASRTMLFDIEAMAWSDELLEAFDIPRCVLPEVRPTAGEFARTAPWAFFGAEVPICSLVGDQQAALFGQLCLEPGMAKNTYGTGGFLLMNTGEKIVHSENGLLSTVAWQLGDQVTYALEGSVFVSGSLMKWLRDGLGLFDDVGATAAMAEAAGSSGGVVIVPAFVGLGAPFWDEEARGSVFGLTLGTGCDQLVRAGLEAMAFQARDVLEAMEADSGRALACLKVDGGASANDFLLQFQADLCGIDVERYATTELTALGAAFLAGIGCGLWTAEELSVASDRVFRPERPRDVMDGRYREWLAAVDACRMWKRGQE